MADSRSDAPSRRYMPEDLNLGGIGIGALAIAIAIAFALIAAYATVHLGSSGPPPRLAVHYGEPPPIVGNVTLQANPQEDIAAFTADKNRLIDSYGWVDREHGIARIPIERAMALLSRGGSNAKVSP